MTTALSPTVLAVALDDAIEDSLKLMLGSCGVEVRCHDSLDSCLQDMAATTSGCIIVDGDFLNVSYDVLLAAVHTAPHPLPVLLLSSRGFLPIGHLRNLGIAGVIRKPLIAEQLAQALAALLQPGACSLMQIGNIEDTLDDGTQISVRHFNAAMLERQSYLPRAALAPGMKSRFLAPLRLLPEAAGVGRPRSRYTDEWAIKAYRERDRARHEIGVARYRRSNGDCAEFAVMTADRWHAKGMTRRLLHHLFERTRLHGFGRLESLVRRNHADVVSLARDLGFQTRPHARRADVLVVGLRLGTTMPQNPPAVLPAHG